MGKKLFDPGPRLSQQGTPLFSSFSVDLRNGTINMIGHAGGVTVQHYIDDGRNGEYAPYLDNFSQGGDVWNRLTSTPGAGPADNQAPILGVTN